MPPTNPILPATPNLNERAAICTSTLLVWISYYKSSSVCLFVCLSVCLFVPYLLRGPLTDLRQTWWVYVGGPRNCP